MKSKRILALILIAVLITSYITQGVYALKIGETQSNPPQDITVTQVKYGKIHDANSNTIQAYIEITGSNLQGINALFSTNTGFQPLGRKEQNLPNFLKYSFTNQESTNFTGSIMIGTEVIDLGLSTFPTMQTIPDKIINVTQTEDLKITGTNLKSLKNADITGSYGKSGIYKDIPKDISDELHKETELTIESPTPPGDYGFQDLRFIKNDTSSDPRINVEYVYLKAFSFVRDLNIPDLEMYPNTGARGDQIYFKSKNLAKAYDVYFLRDITGKDTFLDSNKAKFIGFEQNISGTEEDRLIVEIPAGLSLGSYYVILAESQNNEVVAQHIVGKYDSSTTPPVLTEPEILTVIEATNKATIESIYPAKGPDTGSNVEIIGRNLLQLNIPELSITYDKDTIILSGKDDDKILNIKYNEAQGGIYKNDKEVDVERNIKIQIGKQVKFQYEIDEAVKKYKFILGVPDHLFIRTQQIDDATINPKRDVVIEIETILTDRSTGEKYIFNERIEKKAGYEFIPSSVIPTIDKVVPSKIQVIKVSDSLYEPKDNILIAIYGKDFMVNKYTDESGKTITNYPKIIIKSVDNLDENQFDIKIDKNNNKIEYMGETYDVVDMQVLDNSGNIVDGSVGNEFGTKILITLPKAVRIEEPNLKNVQVVNPKRNSNTSGMSGIKTDAIEFVVADDAPIIESVVPDTVTIEGRETITIIGTNFQNNVKVYIDGQEVPNIKREGDGKKITFQAPPGREGETQLQVINPMGGIAVHPFRYVKTYTDPKITRFAPNKGSKGTLVQIDGDNFLKPDPTARDISSNRAEIYKLIGTRVLLEGVDVNEYYVPAGSSDPGLQNYTNAVSPLFYISQGNAKAADYHHSVILEDEAAKKYYTVTTDFIGNIIISDGVDNKYIIQAKSTTELKAVKEGIGDYDLTVNDGEIVLTKAPDTITLKIKTPYKVEVDSATGKNKITGNMVKVLSKNQIIFTVPQKNIEQWYDLTVVNPDTKKDTKPDNQGFYYFKQPGFNPTITSIKPTQGSAEGGYTIEITGTGYRETLNPDDKTKVYIGGIMVAPQDVSINPEGTKITAVVPRYPGDIAMETGTDRKTVPVVLVNFDGGSVSKEDGFTYVIPTSHPKITKITPNKGNAAGGDIIQIEGSDFRFFEPYNDTNGNAAWDEGEKYQDLNGNGKWDNLLDTRVLDREILPKVYFNDALAEIIEFADGYLVVKTPPGEKGTASVYILNNDFGISPKVSFTYEGSSPKINSIVPNTGRKQGGDEIEINGIGFASGKVKIYSNTGGQLQPREEELVLVRFGNIKDVNMSNREIPVEAPNSGRIVGGLTLINIGNLTVNYNAQAGNVTLKLNDNGKIYERVISYDGSICYFPTNLLLDSQNNPYAYNELIMLEIRERKLIIERGYAPRARLNNSNTQVLVTTPAYYTIGNVPVNLINPDGGIATGTFTYKNPESRPTIINITKDGQSAQEENGYRVVKVSLKGGNIISVIGSDFREGAVIKISDVVAINTNDITYNLPTKLTFTMPQVPESATGKLHRLVVENEDGGVAASDKANPPIYIQFTKGETNPDIISITPDKGPSSGGTRVKIEGRDFRDSMEGIDRGLTVYFGEAEAVSVQVVDYKTIYAVTPPHAPGPVNVRIENPDGEPSTSRAIFTYLSSPKILSVVDPDDPEETNRIETISIEGGQTVKIKGSGFQEGAKVYFSPKITKASEGDTDVTGETIYIEGEYYILEEGIEGKDIVYVDGETITVTTPSGKLGSGGLIVINPDGGASDIYQNLVYGLPTLASPGRVIADLVFDSYIKVSWNGVKDATEYEIYVIINDGARELIGSSELTSYIYQDLMPNTRYRFVVVAQGHYGGSKPSSQSNLVITNELTYVRDKDGDLYEESSQTVKGDIAYINIGLNDFDKRETLIDMTKGVLANSREVRLSIPAQAINSNNAKDIIIMGPDYRIRLNPSNFANNIISRNLNRKDCGVSFRITQKPSSMTLLPNNSISPAYTIEASVFVGKDETQLEMLKTPIEFELFIDEQKYNMRRYNSFDLYKYNSYTKKWDIVEGTAKTSYKVKLKLDQLTIYAILGKRGGTQ